MDRTTKENRICRLISYQLTFISPEGKKDPPEFNKAEKNILKEIQILIEGELKPLSSQGYLYLGNLYNDMGRKEEALEHLKKAEGMFQEMGMEYWLNRTKKVFKSI